jgi:membrane-bound metal-dependent hydrolase YbcI (DUF457 family)
MLGHSHSLSGACTGLAAGICLGLSLPPTAALAGFTAGMALLADLDSVGSCASRSLGFLSKAVAYVIRGISGGHRHATHSVVGIAAFTGLAYLACAFRSDDAGKAGLALLVTLAVSAGIEALHLPDGHMADVIGMGVAAAVVWHGFGLALIPLAVVLGCCTHVIGDACTDSGVRIFYPLSGWKLHLLPEPFAWTTGSRPETMIVTPLLLGALVVLGTEAADPALGLSAWHAVTAWSAQR